MNQQRLKKYRKAVHAELIRETAPTFHVLLVYVRDKERRLAAPNTIRKMGTFGCTGQRLRCVAPV